VPTADRQKAPVQIKVSFDSLDTRVLPEMGAKVTFLADPDPTTSSGAGTAAPAVVWIPRAAVREREGRAVIYVVEGDRARERAVSPRPLGADRFGEWWARRGEAVVLEAPPELKDKSRIRIR
jgi:hypothetical protein